MTSRIIRISPKNRLKKKSLTAFASTIRFHIARIAKYLIKAQRHRSPQIWCGAAGSRVASKRKWKLTAQNTGSIAYNFHIWRVAFVYADLGVCVYHFGIAYAIFITSERRQTNKELADLVCGICIGDFGSMRVKSSLWCENHRFTFEYNMSLRCTCDKHCIILADKRNSWPPTTTYFHTISSKMDECCYEFDDAYARRLTFAAE